MAAPQLPTYSYEVDVQIEAGETWDPVLVWKDENGALVNLTGYSADCYFRKTYDSPVLAQFTTSNGKIVLGGAAGTITFAVPPADTLALLANPSGVMDLRMTVGTRKKYLVHGKYRVHARSTV